MKLLRRKHKDVSDAKELYHMKFEIPTPEKDDGAPSLIPHTSFLGGGEKSPEQNKEVSLLRNSDKNVMTTAGDSPLHIPKWFKFFERKQIKNKMIEQLLRHYVTPVQLPNTKEMYVPADKDVREYADQLKKCRLKDLSQMGRLTAYPLKLDWFDRLKSLKRKEHAVVTIFNDNKTTDTGVIHCYDRTFSRHDMCYVVMSERGVYSPEFRMSHFFYYANNPWPIVFTKNRIPEGMVDSKLMDDLIEMKVIEALAAVNIDMKINILLVMSFLTLIIAGFALAMQLKSSGVIS